jgi:hypothetical protein
MIKKFNLFGKKSEEDQMAENILDIIKDKNLNVIKYADYKRSVRTEINGKEHLISVIRNGNTRRPSSKILFSIGDTYTLVINNKHFIDSDGKSKISNTIVRQIWNVLDKSTKKSDEDLVKSLKKPV